MLFSVSSFSSILSCFVAFLLAVRKIIHQLMALSSFASILSDSIFRMKKVKSIYQSVGR
ncbi:hypothetical protein BDV24DRAFT_29658 [Aspergillus arachidicola]|uniref:Uncharacterized protein n=1 Tax=Aspergillus arachidicola TaxID=656916 RepID=A0A5N6XNY3_9EURO|nr:hypothetical protein BDV24DRAFT_29658 [Aspergillus arachidicola]